MKKIAIIILLFVMSLHKIFAQNDANDNRNDVVILSTNQPVPDNIIKVGHIKIADPGFKTKCSYYDVTSEARKKAKDMGGNIVKITKLSPPDSWSSCYRLTADIYKADDMTNFIKSFQHTHDSLLRTLIPDTADYALLYVYRPSGSGPLIGYKLRMNDDTALCKVRNDSKQIIKLYNTGYIKFSVETETKASVDVKIEHGKIYFLHCGMHLGVFVGEPTISLEKPEIGLGEFNNIN